MPLHNGVRSSGSVEGIESVFGETLRSRDSSISFVGATLNVSEADRGVTRIEVDYCAIRIYAEALILTEASISAKCWAV